MADDLIAFNAAGAEQYKKIAREVTRQMRNETPHRARWQQSSGSGGGDAAACPCVCLDSGDILVNGIETTSRWTVAMSIEIFKQANGTITFPAGTYTLIYDTGTGVWSLDVGDVLTAKYTSGVSATSATTMDGTLTMGFDSYGVPYVKLCVTGTVPAEPA